METQMQPDIPEEYIQKYGVRATSDFWTDFLWKKRLDKKVPVLVEEFMVQLFFVDCDKFGYPMREYTDFISFRETPKMMLEEMSVSTLSEETIYKKTLGIREPLISYNYRPNFYPNQPYIFMWRGEIESKEELPIEKLNVKYLLKLAQEAVKNREGIVVDEAMKNRLIK